MHARRTVTIFAIFSIFVIQKAVAPELEGKGGLYLENCMISKEGESQAKIYEAMFGYMPYAMNPKSVDKLWSLSKQIVAEHSK